MFEFQESEALVYDYSLLTFVTVTSSCCWISFRSSYCLEDYTYISCEVWDGICGKCHFSTISSLSRFNFFQTCKIKIINYKYSYQFPSSTKKNQSNYSEQEQILKFSYWSINYFKNFHMFNWIILCSSKPTLSLGRVPLKHTICWIEIPKIAITKTWHFRRFGILDK